MIVNLIWICTFKEIVPARFLHKCDEIISRIGTFTSNGKLLIWQQKWKWGETIGVSGHSSVNVSARISVTKVQGPMLLVLSGRWGCHISRTKVLRNT